MVATWCGDDSPYLSLPKPAVIGGSKGRARVTGKADENGQHSGEMGGSSPWTRPSAPECGGTLKALVGDQRSIQGGDRPRRRLRGSPSTGSPAGRTPPRGDNVRAGKSCGSQLERCRPWSWTLKSCCGKRMRPWSWSRKVFAPGCAFEFVPEKPAVRLETSVCFHIARLIKNQIKSPKRATSQKEDKATTRMLWLLWKV